LSEDIRYVAVYHEGILTYLAREGRSAASSPESDRYEELLVNPTILTLVQQRGNIDCGGARFVLIRYGNFYQCVTPIRGGHISLCIEPHADPLELVEPIQDILTHQGLSCG
jgi:hypothetical protein